MNKISGAFKNGKAFIAFVTAGDPTLDKTVEFAKIMADSGADLIELGIPFSDPVAEGPVIQKASLRALKAGATPGGVFEAAKKITAETSVPLVFLTYLNPVFNYGYERFFSDCADAGVAGIIVPDMPYEEKKEVLPFARDNGVEIVSLIAPTSEDRIEKIACDAEGFVYCVSSLGVTGVRSEIKTDLKTLVGSIKKYARVPVAVGFGISTQDQARGIAAVSDGVIVGSAIVKIIEKYGADAGPHIKSYVRDMKNAVSHGA